MNYIENDKWICMGYSKIDINASKRCYLNILKENMKEILQNVIKIYLNAGIVINILIQIKV